MKPGTLLDGRFEIQGEAGSGGMGTVYRALDRAAGQLVAVKVLQRCEPHELARFAREVRVVAGVQHPTVVRSVARGATNEGTPSVMEWLEGEDLHERLRRSRLSVRESIALGHRVAEALVEVHARGVVHRDIKPHNLFLCDGQIEKVKLIDFGIARLPDPTREITRSGTTMGTPGYIAPEQARGLADVDARADLFSLGCVLFRCLTGQEAFSGEHLLAVLAKVLLDEVPRVTEHRPEVPEALADLVERMMRKRPDERPRDAAAVVAELAALAVREDLEAVAEIRRASRPSAALTQVEQRLLCVLLVGVEQVTATVDVPSPDAPTVTLSNHADEALRAVARDHEAALDALADGTRLLTLASAGVATDRAAQVARCALAVLSAEPEAIVVLATGRGKSAGRFPVGEVIDGAVRLLRASRRASRPQAREKEPGAPRRVRIDDLTAGLLAGRFVIDVEESGSFLRSEQTATADLRRLLGKPTACVGRGRELRAIEDVFSECAGELVARALVVTGDAGVGKSRLRCEVVQRLLSRPDPPEVWLARGDPMRSGTPFGLLGQIIRQIAGIHDDEPAETARARIMERVALHIDPAARPRVSDFLGEIAGVTAGGPGSAQLQAARRDPALMSNQMRRAWEDLVRAECAARPVLLILEDLHWGDQPSVQYVDAALRAAAELPLLVLALARPEVRDVFPELWSKRGVAEIPLGALTRKACAELARQVLGDELTGGRLDRLWERSAGNAFFLEELLRAAVEGRDDQAPSTVLAMVQSRLDTLSPEARRILRAGSVLGQVFWRGALVALLGGDAGDPLLDAHLADLVEREWITEHPEARLQGERELVFRHALVREVAYEMLTDEDRTLGHLLAGAWLERAGEREAMVIAEHFERALDYPRAAVWYQRAAGHAFEGNDLATAAARAARGLVCIEDPESLLAAELLLVRAKANRWMGKLEEAEEGAHWAMRLFPRGDARWCEAAAEAVHVSGKLGHVEQVLACAGALLALPCGPEGVAAASYALALARAATNLQLSAGRQALAGELLARAEEVAGGVSGDPATVGQVQWARALRTLAEGDVSTFLSLVQASRANLELAGDMNAACVQALNAGHGLLQLGAYEEAAEVFVETMGRAERMGIGAVSAYATLNLGLALSLLGRLDEGRVALEAALSVFRAQADRPMEAIARIYLAMVLVLAGDRPGAAQEALTVIEEPATLPAHRAHAGAILAEVRLAEGRADEALVAARKAMEILGSIEQIEEGDMRIRLAWAEALEATGDRAGARAALAEAYQRLLDQAARIADPERRRSFLERVPEHTRIVRWARAELGAGARAPLP